MSFEKHVPFESEPSSQEAPQPEVTPAPKSEKPEMAWDIDYSSAEGRKIVKKREEVGRKKALLAKVMKEIQNEDNLQKRRLLAIQRNALERGIKMDEEQLQQEEGTAAARKATIKKYTK